MKLRPRGERVVAFVLTIGSLICGQWSNELLAEDFSYLLQEGRPGTHVEDVAIAVDPRLQKHNLGMMHSLDIWQDDGVALIRFDLSSILQNARVKSATLELYSFSVGFSQTEIMRAWPVRVYECKHEWKEGTGHNKILRQDGATLGTFDGIRPWPDGRVTACAGELLATTVHEGGQTRRYKWHLEPSIVEEWILDERPNHGLMVWGRRPGKAVSFASSQTTTVANRPILRVTVDYDPALRFQYLQIGKTYLLSKDTPLAPSWNPTDPIDAILKMKTIPATSAINVVELQKRNNTRWYRVNVISNDGTGSGQGWVNSTALIRQTLKEK